MISNPVGPRATDKVPYEVHEKLGSLELKATVTEAKHLAQGWRIDASFLSFGKERGHIEFESVNKYALAHVLRAFASVLVLETSYTPDAIGAAFAGAADEVEHLNAPEPRDLLNLLISVGMCRLEDRSCTLADVVAKCYDEGKLELDHGTFKPY